MSLKNKLEELNNAWTQLAAAVKKKLAEDKQVLQESNRKLELQMKENSENEKALEQLLKEFKELAGELA